MAQQSYTQAREPMDSRKRKRLERRGRSHRPMGKRVAARAAQPNFSGDRDSLRRADSGNAALQLHGTTDSSQRIAKGRAAPRHRRRQCGVLERIRVGLYGLECSKGVFTAETQSSLRVYSK